MNALEWAKAAYSHAKYTLVIGANNQTANMEKTGGWADVAVNRSRHTGEQWVKTGSTWKQVGTRWVRSGSRWTLQYPNGRFDRPVAATNNHDMYLELAQRAERYRAGNCGENAAVVYAYLHARAQGTGLGHVTYCSCRAPHDHCFVMIGNAWDDGSLIVDPWWGLICTGGDVAHTTGRCFFSEDGDAKDMQEYVMRHGADNMASFVI